VTTGFFYFQAKAKNALHTPFTLCPQSHFKNLSTLSKVTFTAVIDDEVIIMRNDQTGLEYEHEYFAQFPRSQHPELDDVVLWYVMPHTGEIKLSSHFYELAPEIAEEIIHVKMLLALMSPADRYIFQRTFTASAEPDLQCVHSCEVCLSALPRAPRFRFMGRRLTALEQRESCPATDDESELPMVYHGMAVSGQQWVADPEPETVQQVLFSLFAESPIASLITDAWGVFLQRNAALEALFSLSPDRTDRAVGRYSLLLDRQIMEHLTVWEAIRGFYQRAEAGSVELPYYTGANSHTAQPGQLLYLRVSFLPLRDRSGRLERMLIQLQDFSNTPLPISMLDDTSAISSVVPTALSTSSSITPATDISSFRHSRSGAAILPTHVPSPGYHVDSPTTISAFDHQRQTTQPRYAMSHQSLLRENDPEWKFLFDSSVNSLFYLDTHGCVLNANRAAKKWLGRVALRGERFFDLAFQWKDTVALTNFINGCLLSGKSGKRESVSVTIDAQEYRVSLSILPVEETRESLVMISDVTRTYQQRLALESAENRYRSVLEHATDAVWCYSFDPPVSIECDVNELVARIIEHARLDECNQVMADMLGCSRQRLIGTQIQPEYSDQYLFDVQSFVENDFQLVNYECSRSDAQGRRIFYEISCAGLIEDNRLCSLHGVTKNPTTYKHYLRRLEHQSCHDALTGLPNRSSLYKEIERWIQQDDPRSGALLLIDLDRFKEINDTLGHQAGDHLLQQVGPRLEASLNGLSGMVARLGGDEFAIFLPEVNSKEQALSAGQRLLEALRQPFDVDGLSTEISASIGIAVIPDQARDLSTLMRYADVAMYRAKREMRGVSLYCVESDPHSPKRLALMSEVGRAIRENQLCLYFQPKVSLANRHVYGFEALLRWRHPQLGFILPADFIPIVESSRLIHPLTAWVLENSIQQCKRWRDAGQMLSIAVNISARNLMDEGLPERIGDLLRAYGVPAEALELEITESALMSDPARALQILEQLSALGVQLSIDDFGTGYSSLAYLKRLPVKTLKIDRSFINSMLTDRQDELIVNSTIHLAHNLGLKVVAEGVESEALLARLRLLGCDYAQGYHIGKPMDVAVLDKWLNQSNKGVLFPYRHPFF